MNMQPQAHPRIYCGAYRLDASSVRALEKTAGLVEINSADVVHHIENKEIAHTDLRISLRAGGDYDVEGTKTAIVDRLWQACSGPLKYVSDGDRDINPHPSSLLSTAPNGEYSDIRSNFYRFLCLLRFWIHLWVWRSSCRNATKRAITPEKSS
jgi:hypothetical protein